MKLKRFLASAALSTVVGTSLSGAAMADAMFSSEATATLSWVSVVGIVPGGPPLDPTDFVIEVDAFDGPPELFANGTSASATGGISGAIVDLDDEIIISASASGNTIPPLMGTDEADASADILGTDFNITNNSGVAATLSFEFTYDFDLVTSTTESGETAAAENEIEIEGDIPGVLAALAEAIAGNDALSGDSGGVVAFDVDIGDGETLTFMSISVFGVFGSAQSLQDVPELSDVSEPPVIGLLLVGLVAVGARKGMTANS